MLTLFERISGVENDPVTAAKTLQNFKGYSIVATDGERLQMKLVIRVHGNGPQTFRAEEQSIDGNLQALACHPDR